MVRTLSGAQPLWGALPLFLSHSNKQPGSLRSWVPSGALTFPPLSWEVILSAPPHSWTLCRSCPRREAPSAVTCPREDHGLGVKVTAGVFSGPCSLQPGICRLGRLSSGVSYAWLLDTGQPSCLCYMDKKCDCLSIITHGHYSFTWKPHPYSLI